MGNVPQIYTSSILNSSLSSYPSPPTLSLFLSLDLSLSLLRQGIAVRHRLASNLPFSCFSLLNAGIVDMHLHTHISNSFFAPSLLFSFFWGGGYFGPHAC
jgi:hypothetical protein